MSPEYRFLARNGRLSCREWFRGLDRYASFDFTFARYAQATSATSAHKCWLDSASISIARSQTLGRIQGKWRTAGERADPRPHPPRL